MAGEKSAYIFSKSAPQSKLYRSTTNRVLAGVAAGIGDYFGIDATIVRIIFILLAVFGGSGFFIYLLLWIVIPKRIGEFVSSRQNIKENINEIKNKTKDLAGNVGRGSREDGQFWGGIVLFVIGVYFLLANFGVLSYVEFDKLWPLIIIAIGISLLVK